MYMYKQIITGHITGRRYSHITIRHIVRFEQELDATTRYKVQRTTGYTVMLIYH